MGHAGDCCRNCRSRSKDREGIRGSEAKDLPHGSLGGSRSRCSAARLVPADMDRTSRPTSDLDASIQGSRIDFGPGSSPAFVSIAPASARERRVALSVAVLSLLAFAAAVPFVRVPLQQVPAFIPAYEAALIIEDLITAALLFGLCGS